MSVFLSPRTYFVFLSGGFMPGTPPPFTWWHARQVFSYTFFPRSAEALTASWATAVMLVNRSEKIKIFFIVFVGVSINRLRICLRHILLPCGRRASGGFICLRHAYL